MKYIFYFLFLPLWYLERCIPRKQKLWVFGAWSGQKYSDNARALYEYMLEHHPEYRVVWITKNRTIYDRLIREKKPVLMANSPRGIVVCLYASVAIISNGTTDFNAYCLHGIKQVWVWHGMPLKKIGYDERINQGSRIKNLLSRLLIPYFYIEPNVTIVSSEFFVPFMQSAFHIQEKYIFRTGLPRCDLLFSDKHEDLIVDLHKKFTGAKIILYMPTFRTAPYNGLLFNPFTSFGFDEKVFLDILKNKNYIFLYKPHFCDESEKHSICDERFIYIMEDSFNDLYVLLKDIDILMTDYSSVYFDFLVLGKPVILSPFDYEFYIKNARSHYFNYFENIEGVIAKSWNELYDILNRESYYTISDLIKKRYCEYNDGNSCEKILGKLIIL